LLLNKIDSRKLEGYKDLELVLGVVAHTCNPNYSGGIDRGCQSKVSPGKISGRSYLKNKLKPKGLGQRLKW
jgi:hypothetical protein